MKQIGKLKLNQLSKAELNEREMNLIKGGACGCGCLYANSGGSSTSSNDSANYQSGYTSPGSNYGSSCSPCSSNSANESDFWHGNYK
jgi:natural product precursor